MHDLENQVLTWHHTLLPAFILLPDAKSREALLEPAYSLSYVQLFSFNGSENSNCYRMLNSSESCSHPSNTHTHTDRQMKSTKQVHEAERKDEPWLEDERDQKAFPDWMTAEEMVWSYQAFAPHELPALHSPSQCPWLHTFTHTHKHKQTHYHPATSGKQKITNPSSALVQTRKYVTECGWARLHSPYVRRLRTRLAVPVHTTHATHTQTTQSSSIAHELIIQRATLWCSHPRWARSHMQTAPTHAATNKARVKPVQVLRQHTQRRIHT